VKVAVDGTSTVHRRKTWIAADIPIVRQSERGLRLTFHFRGAAATMRIAADADFFRCRTALHLRSQESLLTMVLGTANHDVIRGSWSLWDSANQGV
jgi:hypothetical protein